MCHLFFPPSPAYSSIGFSFGGGAAPFVHSGWHVTITTENIHVEYRRVQACHKQRDSRELSGPPSNERATQHNDRRNSGAQIGKPGDIGSLCSVPWRAHKLDFMRCVFMMYALRLTQDPTSAPKLR